MNEDLENENKNLEERIKLEYENSDEINKKGEVLNLKTLERVWSTGLLIIRMQ